MRSAGCLPNASSNRVTPPVGDSLVPDSCSGLDKLSVRDLLEEASDVPALVELSMILSCASKSRTAASVRFGHGVFGPNKIGLTSRD